MKPCVSTCERLSPIHAHPPPPMMSSPVSPRVKSNGRKLHPMRYEVRFRAVAEDDLTALYDYIAQAASPHTAKNYLDRIEKTCRSLATFPRCGTARDDLAPGIRTIGFERRVTIVFRIVGDVVEIVTVGYGGRDFEADFQLDD